MIHSSSRFGTAYLTVVVWVQGLGKGGAKRHRKILRDNIQGITKPVSCLVMLCCPQLSAILCSYS